MDESTGINNIDQLAVQIFKDTKEYKLVEILLFLEDEEYNNGRTIKY